MNFATYRITGFTVRCRQPQFPGKAGVTINGACAATAPYTVGLGIGFTLLEVMIAIAFIGFAMLALLSLHHTSMESVARSRDLTQAAMLAQGLMTNAEQARFPELGRLSGNFQGMYQNQYPNFRWERVVEPSQKFPDVRRVHITVFYGPGFHRRFELTEFMHNPLPQIMLPGVNGNQGSAMPGLN
jgi:general secretion pathway protein I